MRQLGLILSLFPLLAWADPAVKRVQINIHNQTREQVSLLTLESSGLYAQTSANQETIPPHTSVYEALMLNSFGYDPDHATLKISIGSQIKKLMWQTNTGFGDAEEPKSHLCGVLNDPSQPDSRDHCDIPYVEEGILMIDFYLSRAENLTVQGEDG